MGGNLYNPPSAQTLGALTQPQSDARYNSATAASHRFVRKLRNQTSDANIVVLSDSTGVTTSRWVYLMATQLAAQYPAWTVRYRLWDAVGLAWSAYTTIQTGTGSRTLSVHNAAISGGNYAQHLTPQFATQVTNNNPDLVFISHGHNFSTGLTNFQGTYQAFIETVAEAVPGAPIILVSQNPRTDNAGAQDFLHDEIAWMASVRGYGFVNAFSADTGFSANGSSASRKW
jgi:hypothetical protein